LQAFGKSVDISIKSWYRKGKSRRRLPGQIPFKEVLLLITLKDVAERAGVTVTTVSRMLNNRGYVSEKTRRKITEVMRELNYQPNEVARSLSLSRSSFIGLIVPSAANLFFCKVIDRVEHYVSAHGYKLLLCVSNHELDKEHDYFNMLQANKVAGVILASHTQDIDELLEFDASIITIDRVISPRIPSICSDNYYGGVLAAEHLASRGCKKLAFIGVSLSLNMDGNKRYQGFRDACARLGIESVLIDAAAEKEFLEMRYDESIRQLFLKYPDADGIFTSNDIAAAQLLRACLLQGVKVPDQVKIVGYDDTEIAAMCTPALTTIRQPVDDICRTAVEGIISRTKGRAIPINTVFPVELVPRESS
jgi:LacI family sucrose operon transcriptional repressor